VRHFNKQLLGSDRHLQQAAASHRLTTNTKAPTDSVRGSVLAGDVHEERLRELAGGVVNPLPCTKSDTAAGGALQL
jgi:hypothetical protein